MITWRVADSLETLRKQLNTAFPNRSTVSDGGIGDFRHQASKSSDHNPYIKDLGGVGVVTARDFTHDPKNGLDCNWLAKTLVEARDARIKYIIWNRSIISSTVSAWRWREYTGANPHTQHLHISVKSEAEFYDSRQDWDLDIARSVPKSEVVSDKEINQIFKEVAPNSTDNPSAAAEQASALETPATRSVDAPQVAPCFPAAQNSSILQTAKETYADVREKIDTIGEIAESLRGRGDAKKSIFAVVFGLIYQAVVSGVADFFQLPVKVWIVLLIVGGALSLLYLYRQIALGKVREVARLKLLEIAKWLD